MLQSIVPRHLKLTNSFLFFLFSRKLNQTFFCDRIKTAHSFDETQCERTTGIISYLQSSTSTATEADENTDCTNVIKN